MPESRHSHRSIIRAARPIALLLLVTLFLTGCWRQPEPPRRFVPGEPLYEQFTTSGSRIIVDGDDGPTLKVRQRRTSSRVYDAQMTPVGQIRALDDGQFEQRSRDGKIRIQTQWLNSDVAELPESWRVERADGGWDVFSPGGELLALWRRHNDQWTMKKTYGDHNSYSTHLDNARRKVQSTGGDLQLSTRADFNDLQLLALSLEELPPLPRYTLALWARQNLAAPEPS